MALSGNTVIDTVWRAGHHWYVVHKVQLCYLIFNNDLFLGGGGKRGEILARRDLSSPTKVEPAPLLVKA